MRKSFLTALTAFVVMTTSAQALTLSNVRVTNGMFGAKRADAKFLPGDLIYVNFDMDGLEIDAKTGTAAYQTQMEILDMQNKVVFKQLAPFKKVALLGGTGLPTFAIASLGAEQDRGQYKMRITVMDLRAKKKESFDYAFEVLPVDFGIVRPTTPAVAFAGQDFSVAFSLVGMKRDKDRLPKMTVTLDAKDELGRTVFAKPITLKVQELHDPVLNDLTSLDVIGISFPMFLNRPGNFTFHVEAHDEFTNQKRQLRLPLRVLKATDYTGG